MPDEIPPTPLYKVRANLDHDEIPDASAAAKKALDGQGLAERIGPGTRVCIAVGSRGIDRVAELVRATVDWLHGRGAEPFVLAAMGSHGGATAHGRAGVLAKLGVTEAEIGAPVVTDGETAVVGEADGLPVHVAKAALSADGIALVNRIKPHTSYSGKYESGLCKMLAIGLGMVEGATAAHSRGAGGLASAVPAMARLVLANAPVLFGLAAIENGRDRLHSIEAVPAESIVDREPGLLEIAWSLRPPLPFAEADVLVVDFIGKDISGTGMDTNVIGRRGLAGEPDPDRPRIKRIVALRLSPGSGGNAYGIGLADVTTKKLVNAMDPALAKANAMASTFVERSRVPVAFASDREAVAAAVRTSGAGDPSSVGLARIKDTSSLAEMLVSKPLLDKVGEEFEVISGPLDWEFDERGDLDL